MKGKVEAGKEWVKGKVTSLVSPIVRTFSMKGASHRLTAVPGPPFRLLMASNDPGRIVSRIDHATQQLRRRSPEATDQLAELGKLRELGVRIEKTGSRAERGDGEAAKTLETQLAELLSKIAEYGSRFKATDLNELDPANDVEMTLRLADSAANKKRLAAVDLAIIRLQVERVMGPVWKEFVSTLGPNIWTLSRESLIAVYGKERAERMMQSGNNPLDGTACTTTRTGSSSSRWAVRSAKSPRASSTRGPTPCRNSSAREWRGSRRSSRHSVCSATTC